MDINHDRVWYLKLHWQVLGAMLLGALTGLIFGEAGANAVGWIGDLFMRLLRMIIVPLVFASIVSGVASIGGGRAIGRLFGKTLGYYLLTSFLAASTGLIVVNLFRPGVGASLGDAAADGEMPELDIPTSGIDLLLDIVPPNVLTAAAAGDMLPLIFFSIVLGAAITTLKADGARGTLLGFFEALFQAMVALTAGIIKLLPIGVFALITRMVGTTGFESFAPLIRYFLTVGTGLTIHLFITLPLVLIVLARIAPAIHFKNMRNPLLIAFSTSSSAATLPVTMRAVQERVGVSNKVSSFVLPMGATVNMDGTAVFECVGALFIAQVIGFDLSLGAQVVAVMTALLASIGAAAVPSAGLVVIFIVLDAIGLGGHPQAEAIVLAMLAIDRPLDMYRTAINVFSDSCGAAIIARSEGEDGVDAEVR